MESSRVSQGELGIKRNRLHVELLRRERVFRRAIYRSFAPKRGQVKRVGLRISRSVSPQDAPFLPERVSLSERPRSPSPAHPEGRSNRRRPVVTLRPDVAVVAGVDQLDVDEHAVARAPDAPFQNIRHAQRLADLTHIAPAGFLISHHAGAADYFQIVNLRQACQHVVLNPGGEVGVFFVVTEILKGQHCNALLGWWIRRHRMPDKFTFPNDPASSCR